MFITSEAEALTGDHAWLEAMLDAEAALADAEARAGLIPQWAADRIRATCRAESFDAPAIGDAAVAAGNPAIPLVEALRELVGPDAADSVHFGATSQDIVDTAAMLVAHRALGATLDAIYRLASECARLAVTHRATVMTGRTLLQHAVPTTFGLVAAGWLDDVVDAARRLREIRGTRLAAQLGGAAGTLASLGPAGPAVVSNFAAQLGLAEPPMPWHASRGRIIDLAGALALVAAAAEKVALDVLLLSQTEIAEVGESGAAEAGRSSAMPQKRNSVGAMALRAGAMQTRGRVASLLGLGAHEHQRAAGAWQAEWLPLSEALAGALSAVQRCAELVSGLSVDSARMRANLGMTGGLVMAEAVVMRLAEFVGRLAAQELVRTCVQEAAASGRPFAAVVAEHPTVLSHLSSDDIARLFDPAEYLGSSKAFIDHAIDDYRDLVALSAKPQ